MIPILFDSKEECCGCSACYSICPRDAVFMVEDDEGFVYPKIDDTLCVGCKMCIKVCPVRAANKAFGS